TEAQRSFVQAAGQRVVRELRGRTTTLQRCHGAAMKYAPTSIAGFFVNDVTDLVMCEQVPAGCRSITRCPLTDDMRPEHVVDPCQSCGFVQPSNLAQLIKREPLAKY